MLSESSIGSFGSSSGNRGGHCRELWRSTYMPGSYRIVRSGLKHGIPRGLLAVSRSSRYLKPLITGQFMQHWFAECRRFRCAHLDDPAHVTRVAGKEAPPASCGKYRLRMEPIRLDGKKSQQWLTRYTRRQLLKKGFFGCRLAGRVATNGSSLAATSAYWVFRETPNGSAALGLRRFAHPNAFLR